MTSQRRRSADTIHTGEVARLLLRAAIGTTVITHGTKHARTLKGTAGWFGSIGFRQPRLQAQLSSVVEIGSGAALIAGAAVPLSSAAVVGTMGVAIRTVHAQNGYFITKEGWEYTGFLSVAAIALASLGSGRFSLDRKLGVDDLGTPGGRAMFAAGLGLTGAAAQLAVFWRRPSPPA